MEVGSISAVELLSIPRDRSQYITPDQLSPSNWNQLEYPSLSPTLSSYVSLGYAAVLAVYLDTSPQYIQALGCNPGTIPPAEGAHSV